MKRLSFLCSFLVLFSAANAQIKAFEVIDVIKNNLTTTWITPTVDTFKAGDTTAQVKGVAATFMATIDVLKEAHEKGLNMVITHEPTFYSHLDDMNLHANDEVQLAKLKFINDHNMVVWRFHDFMHRTSPDQVYEGVTNQLNWEKYRIDNSNNFKITPQPLKSVVDEIKSKTGAKTMRLIGEPTMEVSEVCFVLGAAGAAAHFDALSKSKCQLLVVGESSEWETVPYIQDAITIGQQRSLLVMGHADSEEAGMIYFKNWLRELLPNLKIDVVKAGNPFIHVD